MICHKATKCPLYISYTVLDKVMYSLCLQNTKYMIYLHCRIINKYKSRKGETEQCIKKNIVSMSI